MKIWAIADLHLCFGVPAKTMEVFGSEWKDYTQKIETNWKKNVEEDDLVLIAGDTSWAIKPEEVIPDLEWIESLPGTKIMIKGNHDYWWPSLKKLNELLPPSIHAIQNGAFDHNGITIGGSRLWDTEEYSFENLIELKDNPYSPKKTDFIEEATQLELSQKIFSRELQRLKLSLGQINKSASIRIAMTHYPPISADLQDSEASKILEEHGIQCCVFGHLHNVKPDLQPFGEKNGVKYILTSSDYLNFTPTLITEV